MKEVTDANQHFYELKQCQKDNRIQKMYHANQLLGTAHYLLALRGWKYGIRDNDLFVKANTWNNNSFQNIYTGQGLF